MNKKFVYQVGNNNKVILRCTPNQISRLLLWIDTESYEKYRSLYLPV